MSDNNPKIVGYHDEGDVKITTYLSDLGWETRVMKLGVNNGNSFCAEFYGQDKERAEKRHHFWVASYRQNQATVKNEPIKISLTTFLKIMYDYLGTESLVYGGVRDDPTKIFFTIRGGKHRGNCLYDLARAEIVEIFPLWRNIIEEHKSEILDKIAH